MSCRVGQESGIMMQCATSPVIRGLKWVSLDHSGTSICQADGWANHQKYMTDLAAREVNCWMDPRRSRSIQIFSILEQYSQRIIQSWRCESMTVAWKPSSSRVAAEDMVSTGSSVPPEPFVPFPPRLLFGCRRLRDELDGLMQCRDSSHTGAGG